MTTRALLTAAFVATTALSGCDLPRGAAISSEVLREQNAENPSFEVIPVSRANVAQLAQWPATGRGPVTRWIDATRGPSSPLIRTGDSLDITLWDSEENSLLTPPQQQTVQMPRVTVSSNGTVFLPYAGEVVIRGLTPERAREALQSAMEQISPSAQVQVSHTAGRQNAADLVSGVRNPGSFPLADRNTTILSLIAQGGGISADLANPVVRLIREGKTYQISAEKLFADASRNTLLRGGDKVLVEADRRRFTALGATGTEQLVAFAQDSLTAIEALSLIGGLQDSRANPKGVLVLREYPSKALRTDGSGPLMEDVVFSFDLTRADGLFAARNFHINPDDTVLATESPVTSARTILGLLGTTLGVANTLSQ
ncbi:MAG: polysaccharide biosynthesis/export family protein [Paracoccaceae bacterium]